MYGAPSPAGGFQFSAVVNGDMSIAQVTPTGGYTEFFNVTGGVPALQRSRIDMWGFAYSMSNNFNFSNGQSLTHPIFGTQGYSLLYGMNAAAPVMGANDWFSLVNYIENQYLQKLLYQTATLNFFVWSPFTGNHYCALFTGSAGTGGPLTGASIVLPYNVAVAQSWQQIQIPLNLSDVTGIGPGELGIPSSDRGATLHFPLAVGTNWLTDQINIWNASPSSRVAGLDFQNFFNLGANTFKVTDVFISNGTNKTYPRMSTADALIAAQRYYWDTKIQVGAAMVERGLQYYAQSGGAGVNGVNINYPVEMRTAPTITPLNIINGLTAQWRNVSTAAYSGVGVAESIGTKYAFIKNPQVAGDGAHDQMQIGATFDARLA